MNMKPHLVQTIPVKDHVTHLYEPAHVTIKTVMSTKTYQCY